MNNNKMKCYLYSLFIIHIERWDSERDHKGTPCFFSTESQYDHPVSSHVNNQIHEAYLEEYQSVVL